jgi:hypothetical protein
MNLIKNYTITRGETSTVSLSGLAGLQVNTPKISTFPKIVESYLRILPELIMKISVNIYISNN